MRSFIDEGSPFMPSIAPTIEVSIPKPEKLKEYRNELWMASGREMDALKSRYQRFRFVDGVLYRDFENAVLKFSEKDLQYALLQKAFEEPLEEWIDVLNLEAGIKTTKRSIYDAAIALNKKIAASFKIQDYFFEMDKTGNRCRRMAL